MKLITKSFVASMARWVLNGAGAFLVAKGYLDDAQATELVGIGASGIALAWSVFTHSTNVLVNKSDIVRPTDPKVPPY